MEPSAGHVIKILEGCFGYRLGIKKLLKTNKYEIHVRRGSSLLGSVPLGRIPLRNLGQVPHAQEVSVRRGSSLVGSVHLGRIPLRNLGQVLHAQEVSGRRSGSLVGLVPSESNPT